MMELFTALIALTAMEILLGIDNVIFVSIIMGKIPEKDKKRAGGFWMIGGFISRIVLLFGIGLLINAGGNLFSINEHIVGLKDLVMIGGGLFLLISTTKEIHNKIEGTDEGSVNPKGSTFIKVMLNIFFVDLIFSIDGVITAVGMSNVFWIQATAICLAMLIMFIFSSKISHYVEKHPTFKILALSFLLLIAVILIVEGVNIHEIELPKGYIYFAMAFSFGVELLNATYRKKRRKEKTLTGKHIFIPVSKRVPKKPGMYICHVRIVEAGLSFNPVSYIQWDGEKWDGELIKNGGVVTNWLEAESI